MKVLLVSSLEPYSLGASYFRAFSEIGCEPHVFDVSREYERSIPFARNKYINRVISPLVSMKANDKLISVVDKTRPDLVFVHKGQWIRPDTLGTIKTGAGSKLINFNPDDPFNEKRGASNSLIRSSIPFYDVYFTWSNALIEKIRDAGAQDVRYLPFAADTTLHRPEGMPGSGKVKHDKTLSFVGNWDEERENCLSALNGYDLSIWGTDYWDRRCTDTFLKSCWKGKPALGKDMSEVIQSSKINLNVLRVQNKGSHNMRTFEIPACGGFMLHERSKEVLSIFEENREIACFSSVEELKSKAAYYAGKDSIRDKMAQRAHQKIKKHTYRERVQQVMKVYQGLVRSKS